MPTSREILARQVSVGISKENKKVFYEGPVVYRGQQINWRHSIKRVVKTLRRSLQRSQFASLNIVGIPGSGKTTCAVNIVTELVEEEELETKEVYHVHWKGAEDLRNLGEVLENLPKYQNHIIVFDDVSKALERLSGSEQAEVFEQLTTTRHVTGGRLLLVSLYHYTFANLKSVKSQGVVVIYTSCTLTEYGNISQMLPNKKAQQALRKFVRIYENAYMRKEFELSISKNQSKTFVDGDPFRPCFVINLFRAHIGLFMRLEKGFWPPASLKQKIDEQLLYDKILHNKSYQKDGKLALRIITMQKGHPQAMRGPFVCAYKFVMDLIQSYDINWSKMAGIIKDPGTKNLYRPRKMEAQLRDELVKESKQIQKEEEAKIVEMPKEPEIQPSTNQEGTDEETNLDDEFGEESDEL